MGQANFSGSSELVVWLKEITVLSRWSPLVTFRTQGAQLCIWIGSGWASATRLPTYPREALAMHNSYTQYWDSTWWFYTSSAHLYFQHHMPVMKIFQIFQLFETHRRHSNLRLWCRATAQRTNSNLFVTSTHCSPFLPPTPALSPAPNHNPIL